MTRFEPRTTGFGSNRTTDYPRCYHFVAFLTLMSSLFHSTLNQLLLTSFSLTHKHKRNVPLYLSLSLSLTRNDLCSLTHKLSLSLHNSLSLSLSFSYTNTQTFFRFTALSLSLETSLTQNSFRSMHTISYQSHALCYYDTATHILLSLSLSLWHFVLLIRQHTPNFYNKHFLSLTLTQFFLSFSHFNFIPSFSLSLSLSDKLSLSLTLKRSRFLSLILQHDALSHTQILVHVLYLILSHIWTNFFLSLTFRIL